VKSSNRTRARRGAAVVALAFGLVAAACGGGDGGSDESTEGSGDSVALTEAPQETQAPAVEIVMGGKLVVGGEAEVANPWTPAAIQCDSFCQMRARSFYDPLVVVDENLDYQPYLAETIEPNADNTVFTVTIRQGIKFHDGTDLDAATQQRLDRGYRMVELLKQGQFAPMDVVDQVLSIYAGTRGHLDEVKRDEVADWEKGFLTFVRDQIPELRKRIDESKELDAESERQLEAAIAEFKRQRAAKSGESKQLAGAR